MKITKGLIKAYSRMGQKGAASGVGMVELARIKPEIRAVVADSISIASLGRFNSLYPDKVVNVGVAEQDMIGIAAGLASEDNRCVFAFTYSAFIIARALEQVRLNLAYHNFNVKIVGNSAGFAMEMLGVSHWAIEDIAFTRVLPNMTVLSACDSLQAIKMIMAAAKIMGPVYIRLSGGQDVPIVYNEDYDYQVGKGNILRKGDSGVAIIATGMMVYQSLLAADILQNKGINCTIVDMHTIKPLDNDLIDQLSLNHKLLVTVEEHSIIGGLGSAIAEYNITKPLPPRQIFIGASDQYLKLGTQEYIWQEYGLTSEQIADRIVSEIEK